MQRKDFRSRLFKRNISKAETDYWQLLHAEVLFRLKALRDLNCPCSFCFREKVQIENLIDSMAKDGHIPENPKPKNFTGKGNCGRRLGPTA